MWLTLKCFSLRPFQQIMHQHLSPCLLLSPPQRFSYALEITWSVLLLILTSLQITYPLLCCVSPAVRAIPSRASPRVVHNFWCNRSCQKGCLHIVWYSKACKTPQSSPWARLIPAKSAHDRWIKQVKIPESRTIWEAIDWNGKLTTEPNVQNSPANAEFYKDYIKLMNPPIPSSEKHYVPDCHRYIPLLNDPLNPIKISSCILDLETNKSPGVDGVPLVSSIFLYMHWPLLLTFLFNFVFYGSYPLQWAIASKKAAVVQMLYPTSWITDR